MGFEDIDQTIVYLINKSLSALSAEESDQTAGTIGTERSDGTFGTGRTLAELTWATEVDENSWRVRRSHVQPARSLGCMIARPKPAIFFATGYFSAQPELVEGLNGLNATLLMQSYIAESTPCVGRNRAGLA